MSEHSNPTLGGLIKLQVSPQLDYKRMPSSPKQMLRYNEHDCPFNIEKLSQNVIQTIHVNFVDLLDNLFTKPLCGLRVTYM